MSDLSKATILGYIGKKNARQVKTGMMTTLSIATHRKWKGGDGEEKKSTSWHQVNMFGQLAEIADKFTEVGDRVYVEGRINNEKIADGNGEKWVYSITGDNIIFLSPKKESQMHAPTGTAVGNAMVTDETDDVPF